MSLEHRPRRLEASRLRRWFRPSSGDRDRDHKPARVAKITTKSFYNAHTVQNQAAQQNIYGNVNFYSDDATTRQQQRRGENVTLEQRGDFCFREPAGICLAQAPYIEPKLFIGRASELCEMDAMLKPGHEPQEPRRLVLGGQGGVGKSQLAIAYVNCHRCHYQSVFWLDATSKATVENSYRSIAEQLFDAQLVRALDSIQSMNYVRQWLSDSRNTQWLMVFDNYDDPDQYDLQDFLPLAPHGTIIITTRRPDRVSGETIYLKTIDDDEDSLEILATRSQRTGARTDPYAKRLAVRLGGLPLALATAGAYLRTSPMTFGRYLREYEERWNIDPYRPVRLPEYQDRTLYTTWNLSYMRLKEEDSGAAELLKLFAYFDNQNIWFDLLHAGGSDDLSRTLRDVLASESRFFSAMKTLTDYCFVEVQESTAMWSIHNCVHDWTLAALNTDIDVQQYWYAFDCVAGLLDDKDCEMFCHLSYARIAAHAVRLVRDRFWDNKLVFDFDPHRVFRGVLIGQLLRLQNHLSASEQLYHRLLASSEKTRGLEDEWTLDTANNLANLYQNQKKFAEAEQMYQRALAGYERVLGPEHVHTLTTMRNLGLLYDNQNRFVEAEQMYQRTLAASEKLLGSEHSLTFEMVHNLGSLFQIQGRLNEAEQMYQRALAGIERILGPEHIYTISTTFNLGLLYEDQGRLDDAERMFQRAFESFRKELGPSHRYTLDAARLLNNLSSKWV